MNVFEAMDTARAMRYLKPDPVPKELLEKLIYYASRASNPGNSQLWQFIVLQDEDKKRRIGDAIAQSFRDTFERQGLDTEGHSGYYLAAHLAQAPAIIFIGARNEYPPWQPDKRFVGSARYPAGQNLIVAVGEMGLGGTFTLMHAAASKLVHETLEIPEELSIALTIPIGYPQRTFGPVRRKPTDEIIHWDTFSGGKT